MGLFNYFFFPFLVVLLGMLVGAPLFEYLIKVIPAFITDGIKVASNMLPALGFALLMQLTYNKELAPYLFIRFCIRCIFRNEQCRLLRLWERFWRF